MYNDILKWLQSAQTPRDPQLSRIRNLADDVTYTKYGQLPLASNAQSSHAVTFKIVLLAWNCTHGTRRDILHPRGKRPRSHTAIYGRLLSAAGLPQYIHAVSKSAAINEHRSPAFYGPTAWISLPFALRDDGLPENKRKLKTRVFPDIVNDADVAFSKALTQYIICMHVY